MTYSALIADEGSWSQFLCVLKPARIVTGWVNVSGNVYYASFDYGNVIEMTNNGVTMTADTSTSPASGRYYFDYDNNKVYINVSTPTSKTFVATYEIYVGTIDANWYRVPTDDTTRVVYYEPFVIKSPEIKASISSSIFGYMPTQSTSIELSNAEHNFEYHVHDSSFNKRQIDVYHCVANPTNIFEFDTENCKLLLAGNMGNVSYDGDKINITINDRSDYFDKEYRNLRGSSFFTSTEFANLDPTAEGNPIRGVFGYVPKIKCTNIDYVENGTTSNNRNWIVCGDWAGNNYIYKTVSAAPASTTTRTYIDTVTGIQVGDTCKIDKTTDEYVTVTAVGVGYIDHTTLVSGAASSGDQVFFYSPSTVYIIQDGKQFTLTYGTHYIADVFSSYYLRISLTSGVEAALGMETLTGREEMYARVYGKDNYVTLNATPFGSNSSPWRGLTNAAVIMVDMIQRSGVSDSSIDATTFGTIKDLALEVGFAVPDQSTGSFPHYKSIINNILQSWLLKLSITTDGKWKLEQMAPMTTSDIDTDDTEILRGSFSYEFDYSEILSSVRIRYQIQELNNLSFSKVATSNTATRLHKVSKDEIIDTYLLNSSDAETIANRIMYYRGDRSGIIKLKVKNKFFNTEINDTVQVSREKMPGYAYTEGTDRTRLGSVLDIDKNSKHITILLDDQKGVQDNSGSW